MQTFDAVVIGGGPAGAAIGRLLANWGRSVAILAAAHGRAPALAESLPPSIRKLFDAIGVLGDVDAAGFLRASGNISWWGDARGRPERFPGPSSEWGYQVRRSDFDRLLLASAQKAGADVRRGARVERVDLEASGGAIVEYRTDRRTIGRLAAPFVLDCSGRAGVIARAGFRVVEPEHRTLAIVGEWQRDGGWGIGDGSETLIETCDEGWVWSVPVSAATRHIAMMIDPPGGRGVRKDRPATLRSAYLAALAKTRRFRELIAQARLQRPPWTCDASLYSARAFAGDRFLLIGDAGSFIDPLSSFGVKKALASAWVGAIVVNTCLARPGMRGVAIDFFSARERQVYDWYLREAIRYFHDGAARHPLPFWLRRSGDPAARLKPCATDDISFVAPADPDRLLWETDEDALRRDPGRLAAWESLRAAADTRLEPSADARIEQRPAIAGREIVLEDAVVAPGLPAAARVLLGVEVPRLIAAARDRRTVPDLFEACSGSDRSVSLPIFLEVVSILLARRVLVPITT